MFQRTDQFAEFIQGLARCLDWQHMSVTLDYRNPGAEFFSKVGGDLNDEKVEEIKDALDEVFEEEEPRPQVEKQGETFVEFDQRPRRLTLYPGNVETVRFEAETVTVVVGQIVDEAGQPVANAYFDGLSGFAGTDAEGWFQLELTGDAAAFEVRRSDAPNCRVTLPAFTTDNGVAVLDAVTCTH